MQEATCSSSDVQILIVAFYYNAYFQSIGRKAYTGTGEIEQGVLNPDLHTSLHRLPYDSGFPVGTLTSSTTSSSYNYKNFVFFFPACNLTFESTGAFYSTINYVGSSSTVTFIQSAESGISCSQLF